jgi:N-acetylated-alpha-linked acidic dipeptidase
MAVTMLRMADAPILPFSFSDAALTYAEYVTELSQLAAAKFGEASLDVSGLRSAVGSLAEAGGEFDRALETATALGARALDRHRDALEAINKQIYFTERDLGTEDGLPRRPWFRHMIYAPGFYTGYGVKTVPAVREALEQGDLEGARRYTLTAASVVERMVERVRDVTAQLQALR